MNDSREKLLIHRALEHRALEQEWDELSALAHTDPLLWRRLAHGLRDEGALRRGLEHELSPADRVELPAVPAAGSGRRSRLVLVSGWAATILLAALWLGSRSGSDSEQASREAPADTDSPVSGTELVGHSPARRAVSSVIDELPAMMIETVPTADGTGYDVLFLRRTVERIRVNGVFQLAQDEHGLPAPSLTRWSPDPITERM